MKIGLIGCGKIGSAVMTGYCSEGGWNPEHVFVSPRTKAKADALRHNFPHLVTISSSNQEVLDNSDVIFIGLLPDVAQQELPQLQFTDRHWVVSMMATIQFEDLLKLLRLPLERVIRTIPLPSSSQRVGPILAYPKNEKLGELLSHVGTPIMLEQEDQVKTLTGMTSLISYFYATCGHLQGWCASNGVDSKSSRDYIAAFFNSLAFVGKQVNTDFHEMAEEAATPGGLNEQVHRGLTTSGNYDLVLNEVDAIFKRLTQRNPAPRQPNNASHQ